MCDLAFIHQLLVQAAGLTGAQNAGGHIQLGIASLEHGRCVPCNVHARQFHAVADLHTLFAGQLGLLGHHGGHRVTGLERAKVFLQQGLGLRGLEVTRQHQGGVVGAVVAASKRLHVLELDGLNIGVRADDHGAIRVACWKQRLERRFIGHAVGAVFNALAAFIAHHVLLIRQCDGVHLVGHIAQHVRLDPQAQLQLVGG